MGVQIREFTLAYQSANAVVVERDTYVDINIYIYLNNIWDF